MRQTHNRILAVIFIGLLFGSAFLIPADAVNRIPPTRAFQVIKSGTANVTAQTYNANLTLVPGTGMNITMDYSSNSILFSANNNSSGNTIYNQTAQSDRFVTGFNNITGVWTTKIFSIDNMTCTANSFVKQINNITGVITCATPSGSSGSAFTNIYSLSGGTGSLLHRNNSNTAIFKSITAGAGISITNGSSSLTIKTNINNQTADKDNFLIGYNNFTNIWTTKRFSIDNQTCTGANFIQQANNITGTLTCASIPSGGITSINSQTGAAQTLQGTSRNVTISSAVNTHTFNLGDLVVIINGAAQTVTKSLTLNALKLGGTMDSLGNTIDNVGVLVSNDANPSSSGVIRLGTTEKIGWRNVLNTNDNTLDFATNTLSLLYSGVTEWTFSSTTFNAGGNAISSVASMSSSGADPADAGFIRMLNNDLIASEASPAGVDGTIGFNANEEWEIIPTTSEAYSFNATHFDVGTNKLGGTMGCSDGQYLVLGSGDWDCTPAVVGGFTNIYSLGGGQAKILHRNNSNTAIFKSITAGAGISITNGSSSLTIKTNINNQTADKDNFLIGYNNFTNIWTTKRFSIDNQTANQKDLFVIGLNNITGSITTNRFSIDNGTCNGNRFVSQVNNITGAITCATPTSTGGSGFTNIASSPPTTAKILRANASNSALFKTLTQGQGITITNNSADVNFATNFKINTQVTDNRKPFFGFSNSTGDFVRRLFTINTQSGTEKDLHIIGIDNQTGSISTVRFSIDNGTCNGNRFVSQVNNITGAITCATPTSSGGSGFTQINNRQGGDAKIVGSNSSNIATIKSMTAGTGITITNGSNTITVASASGYAIPSQDRWGSFFPTSATTVGTAQLATSLLLDGTETFEYNTTRGLASIRAATGAVAGNNAGISQTAANVADIYRRDQNPRLYIEGAPAADGTTNTRLFIGFRSSANVLPNATDNIVSGVIAFGVCVRSTDTIYQICYNDGAGVGTYTSSGVTENTNWHTFLIYADSTNNQWCASIDAGTATCSTTDIPQATQRLFWEANSEAPTAISRNFNYGTVYVQNDK